MLTQAAQCFVMYIDFKSHNFGGRGSNIFEGDVSIPLRLEKALMTCPIRMPTPEELDTLHIYWLTDAAPWDPTTIFEPLDDTMPAHLVYSNVLGELDLGLSDFGEVTTSTLDETVENEQGFHWIELQKTSQMISTSIPE